MLRKQIIPTNEWRTDYQPLISIIPNTEEEEPNLAMQTWLEWQKLEYLMTIQSSDN